MLEMDDLDSDLRSFMLPRREPRWKRPFFLPESSGVGVKVEHEAGRGVPAGLSAAAARREHAAIALPSLRSEASDAAQRRADHRAMP